MTPEQRNQRAFDRAVTGVIAQGTICRAQFLDPNTGRKCAIGMLVKPERFTPTGGVLCANGVTVGSIVGLLRHGEVHKDLNDGMLYRLQLANDYSVGVEDFKIKARQIAKDFNLDPKAAL